jgi:hypothetical protein
MRRLPRLIVLAAMLACALVASGCGNRVSERTVATTEGPYIDLDNLKYQVQISRYLNPNDVEDKTYLSGLPAGTPEPGGDETWFGVFMRVWNPGDTPAQAADTFQIVDTQGNTYSPIAQDPKVNPYAFVPGTVPPKSLIPTPDSIAAEGVIKQGALLLFKIKTDSLQNRPLVLKFKRGNGTTASINLDV